MTWFVDVATGAVCGLAVTPGYPSRESILAALRSAILRGDRYGAVGGLPGRIRMDRGKDFLSTTVVSVLAALAVVVQDVPAYQPHLKGTVEQFNNAAEQMFFAELPRYTHAQQLANRRTADPDQPGLAFETIVERLLEWVAWWNTGHRPERLGGRTPAEAWTADPTPVQRAGRPRARRW